MSWSAIKTHLLKNDWNFHYFQFTKIRLVLENIYHKITTAMSGLPNNSTVPGSSFVLNPLLNMTREKPTDLHAEKSMETLGQLTGQKVLLSESISAGDTSEKNISTNITAVVVNTDNQRQVALDQSSDLSRSNENELSNSVSIDKTLSKTQVDSDQTPDGSDNISLKGKVLPSHLLYKVTNRIKTSPELCYNTAEIEKNIDIICADVLEKLLDKVVELETNKKKALSSKKQKGTGSSKKGKMNKSWRDRPKGESEENKSWRDKGESEEKRSWRDKGGSREKKKKPIRKFPTHFLALQVTNPKIHEALEAVQDIIEEKCPDMELALLDLDTLHITLMVMHLAVGTDGLERAKKAIDESISKIKGIVSEEKPLVTVFKGLNHFGNKILFACPVPDEQYTRLTQVVETVVETFAENDIFTTDSHPKPFNGHLTIAKISRDPFALRKKGITKIDPSLYEEHKEQHFGVQVFDGIQLCAMKGDPLTNYYKIEYEVKFGEVQSEATAADTDKVVDANHSPPKE